MSGVDGAREEPAVPGVAPAQIDGVVAALRELAGAVRALAPSVPHDPDALLTAEQVGELLAIPTRTVKDQAAAGVLPHRRFGKHYRFSRDDVADIVRLAGKAGLRPGGATARGPTQIPAPRRRAGR